MLKAGFAEVEITPEYFPVTTYMGHADSALDPLFAQCAVFSDGLTEIMILSVNVVMLEFAAIERIRSAVTERSSVRRGNILISATHNHACPAVIDRPGFPREDRYMEFLVRRLADCAFRAESVLEDASLYVSHAYEKRINFNRRFILRDGSVVSEPGSMENVLFNEGIVDPFVGVLRAAGKNGSTRGIIVNFACHATHDMGKLSGGYPGVMRRILKQKYPGAEIVFLNGPCGNINHRNYEYADYPNTSEFSGTHLAEDVVSAAGNEKPLECSRIETASDVFHAEYRPLEELRRNIADMRRLNVLPHVIPWYRWSLAELEKLHSSADGEECPLLAFALGKELAFAAIPCEYFSQHSLSIREHSPFQFTFLCAPSNGWLGYVPHPDCFKRPGGHETTAAYWSKMAVGTGAEIESHTLRLLEKLNETL